MRTDRELLEQALTALNTFAETIPGNTVIVEKAIGAITSRLADSRWYEPGSDPGALDIPLYRHPTRQQVRLSDEEIQECFDAGQKSFLRHQSGIKGQMLTIRDWPFWHFAKAIEQAVLEKNQ